MTTAIIGVGNIGGTVAHELASGGEPVLLSATSSDKVQKPAAGIGTPATVPTMTFRSTGIRHSEDGFDVDGELTLHGVTRPVTLALDVNGFTRD